MHWTNFQLAIHWTNFQLAIHWTNFQLAIYWDFRVKYLTVEHGISALLFRVKNLKYWKVLSTSYKSSSFITFRNNFTQSQCTCIIYRPKSMALPSTNWKCLRPPVAFFLWVQKVFIKEVKWVQINLYLIKQLLVLLHIFLLIA